jgi:hypothetical protein
MAREICLGRRFLVELPATTLNLLIAGRWLRRAEADDPLAVLTALKRVGLSATVLRREA